MWVLDLISYGRLRDFGMFYAQTISSMNKFS
jgi:hypothetical protein